MKWHELEQTWRVHLAGADIPEWNVADFEVRRRRLARTLARRDWLEAGTGLFVAAVFALPAVHFGAAAWPAWPAVGLVLLVTGFFVRERHRARRATPASDAPMLVRLDAEIRELEHQHRLLRHAGWWYVLPLLSAMALFTWALHAAVPGRVTPEMQERLVVMGLGALALGAGIIWLNRWTARRTVAPRLRQLREARANLTTA